MLFDIYTYRFFIINSVKNEFITKFIRSKIGLFWVVINPLLQVLIYFIVLSSVLAAKIPSVDGNFSYATYLMSGMLCWGLFSEILSRITNVFIQNANLIKKMPFPKIALPLIVVFSALINNLLLLACVIIILFCFGYEISFALFHLLILMIMNISLSFSLGLFFGILNVFVRDVGHIINISLQFFFWLTPIVYTINLIPTKFQILFLLNPLAKIVQLYQQVLVYGKIPIYTELIYPAVFSLIFLSISMFIYNKAKYEMADVL